MDFLEGGDLFTHIRKNKGFSEKQSKFIVACVVLGIGHLHNQGYVYRDLKPENLLFDNKGYAYVTDFGLAKKLQEKQKTNTFCGTSEYMAPETILGWEYER